MDWVHINHFKSDVVLVVKCFTIMIYVFGFAPLKGGKEVLVDRLLRLYRKDIVIPANALWKSALRGVMILASNQG